MKAIILAGGSGTRLYPLTLAVSKQLMPVYDKPMIYYPLSTIMLAGCKDILVISTPKDLPGFQNLLGDGESLGVNFSYAVQPSPDGLAQAFVIGKEFIGDDSVALILGDNIFYGQGLARQLQESSQLKSGATIFAYYVSNPSDYGVVEFDDSGKAVGLEEKPADPRSNYAVPGIYFYDNEVVKVAEGLKPSPRGELEITDINKHYLDRSELRVEVMGRGTAWLDTGQPKTLIDAANFISTVEQRQGLRIGCIEEVAYRMGFIDRDGLNLLGQSLGKSDYGQYLCRIASE
ncbi:MAG: glucose-1-phosphate thymidylyltransferase RfbA [Myxococcota bacterium]|jgi:glucose-1-phosphate thymidylyltransferase|nr:glucose-1-phosphate thymidylyltransferase RfbA [Myxococcota bacterium]